MFCDSSSSGKIAAAVKLQFYYGVVATAAAGRQEFMVGSIRLAIERVSKV